MTKVYRNNGLVDLYNLQVEDVKQSDIAYSLSNINRFCGSRIGNYGILFSVLEHSIVLEESVARLLNIYPDKNIPENALMLKSDSDKLNAYTSCLVALWHDAAEAFINDIPAPVKKVSDNIKDLEGKVFKRIVTYIGLGQAFSFSYALDLVEELDKMSPVAEVFVMKTVGRSGDNDKEGLLAILCDEFGVEYDKHKGEILDILIEAYEHRLSLRMWREDNTDVPSDYNKHIRNYFVDRTKELKILLNDLTK